MDLRTLINSLIEGNTSAGDVITFLEDNRWFGHKPSSVELTDEQVALFTSKWKAFTEGDATVERMFADAWPVTYRQYCRYRKRIKYPPDDEDTYYILAFLLHTLDDDLVEYSNNAVRDLLRKAHTDLTKEHGDFLTDFLAWLRARGKTGFTYDYSLNRRYKMTVQNEAYDKGEYLELLYKLTNELYIEDNAMYLKASQSQKYVDAWLYMSMHFVCSVRLPDLERLPHPYLQDPPEKILKQIGEDTYPHEKILLGLHSVVKGFEMMELKPSKTEKHQNIETVKLNIPTSCRIHYGKLFLMAEAHRQIAGDKGPIIRKISTYQEIKRAMGDEIAALFLTRDFGSRSATKSFLQSRFDMTSEVLGVDNSNLAARLISHARSHKGSYGSYAQQSIVYLKDAKFTGYTYEQVAYELLERGVLSFIPFLLLDMATKGKSSSVDAHSQTELIKVLNISADEAEQIVMTVDSAKERAREVVNEMITAGVDILAALKSIAAGTAFAKQDGCMCLLSAVKTLCPYTDRAGCIGCRYEISTTSTLMHLVSEYKRLLELGKNASNPTEKAKYKEIARTTVIPAIQEALDCLQEYDEHGDYEKLVKELIYG